MRDYLAKADILIGSIIKEVIRLESGESEKDIKPTFFYYSIVYKTIFTLKSILKLLNDLQTNENNKIAICLLLRDIMSDLISVQYVVVKNDQENHQISQTISNMYYNHYRFTRRILSLYDQVYHGDEKFKEMKDNILQYEKGFINENGEIPKYLEAEIGTFQMIRFILSNGSDEEKRFTTVLFEQFAIFSKLAHFGELTMRLIAENFMDRKTLLGCVNMTDAIGISISYSLALVEELSNGNFEHKESLDKLFGELDALSLCS